jgi:hypothetical protein
MSKTVCLASLLALGACTEPADQTPTPLASLHATVQVQTNNDAPMIEPGYTSPTTVTIGGGNACPRIEDDATVTLDGVAMTAESRGGAWDDFEGKGCDPIIFTLDQSATPAHSQLVIRDSSATWTIEGDNLFGNRYAVTRPAVAGGTAEITWADTASIDFVYAQFTQGDSVMFTTYVAGPPVYTTSGNHIELAIPANVTGPGTLSLNAGRAAKATRCDGPEQCVLSVVTGADLPVVIASGPSIDERVTISDERR